MKDNVMTLKNLDGVLIFANSELILANVSFKLCVKFLVVEIKIHPFVSWFIDIP